MNYELKQNYTFADILRWRHLFRDKWHSGLDLKRVLFAAVLSGGLFMLVWIQIFPFWKQIEANFPMYFQAACYLLIGVGAFSILHYAILPVLARLLRVHRNDPLFGQDFSNEIIIDDEFVVVRDEKSETRYRWDLLTEIEDFEHTVVLSGLSNTVFISAKAFDGFLAKDAFVRACRHRLGYEGLSSLEAFD